MKKLLIVAAAGALASLAFGSTARATEPTIWAVPQCAPCTSATHYNSDGFLLNVGAEPNNPPSGSTVEIKENGAELSTPEQQSKIWFAKQVNNLPLASVASLSYRTYQLNGNAVALPSYQLVIDYDGGDTSTGYNILVFEPYLQPGFSNDLFTWKTWDALKSGDALWWSTKDLPGMNPPKVGSNHQTWKFKDIVVQFPNAVIKAYALNMGSGNAGAKAQVNDYKFGTANTCVIHKWSTKYTPSASPSPSASASPSVSPSPSKSAAAPLPTAGLGGPTLPVTGDNTPMIVGAGIILVLGGTGILLASRKRRNRVEFTNE